MDPDKPHICIADVVVSLAGHDSGQLFYVVGLEGDYALLANGKERKLEQPKKKRLKHVSVILRADTVIAGRLRSGGRVLNSELRKDLAQLCQDISSHNQGG